MLASGTTVASVPDNLEEFLYSSQHLRTAAHDFRERRKTQLSESEMASRRAVYVNQHEFAVSHPGDDCARVLGSEDATTCHIVVLRHPASGMTALAHVDVAEGSNLDPVVDRMRQLHSRIAQDDFDCEPLDLSVVGGYEDENDRSEELTVDLLKQVIGSSTTKFRLGIFCVGSANTSFRSGVAYPVHYGCAVDVASGEVFPAGFDDQGPDRVLRHARTSFNRQCPRDFHEIYSCGRIAIQPFPFAYYPGVETWLRAPSRAILSNMSTSPMAEPPNFVPTLKQAIALVVENKDVDTMFQGGRPRVYSRSQETNRWIRVQDQEQDQNHQENEEQNSAV